MIHGYISQASADWVASNGESRASVVSDLEKYLIAKQTGGLLDSPQINGYVNEQSALSIATHLACVRAIGEDLGGVTRKLYQRGVNGDRSELPNHPLAKLLREPNPTMTALEFYGAQVSTCAAWGNAYAYLKFDSRYNVDEMWPIAPWAMRAELLDGVMVFTCSDPRTGAQTVLSADQVWHLKGPSLDGVTGMSVIRQCADAFSLAKVEELYAKYFFENSARGDAYFMHPGTMSDEAQQRFREAMNSRHRGVANAHKSVVLEEGMEVKTVSMPLKEVMLIEARQMSNIQILGLHRMPPHKVGILDRATFSNIEHQAIQYVTDVIGVWGSRLEQSLMRCLMGPGERARMFIEHKYDSLLRGDVKSRNEAYASGIQNGWLSRNDVRRLENLPPIEGGDVYLQPLNMVDAAKPQKELVAT